MKVLIIDASSAIAEAFARLYAQQYRASIVLIARSEQKLQMVKEDLIDRAAHQVDTISQDLAVSDSVEAWLTQAFSALGRVDVVLIAQGLLSLQEKAQLDFEHMHEILHVNGLAQIDILAKLANRIEAQGSGTIACIFSVSGDRGRPSKYVYGTSKAMVTTFLQGLRAWLFAKGVNVLTVKPGFVDTPMTTDIEMVGPLWASLENVAEGIVAAIKGKKSEVYLPSFWRYIMLVIRNVSEFIFKRLSLQH